MSKPGLLNWLLFPLDHDCIGPSPPGMFLTVGSVIARRFEKQNDRLSRRVNNDVLAALHKRLRNQRIPQKEVALELFSASSS